MKVEKYTLRELKWDTSYFGVKCGKIDFFENIEEKEFIEINKFIKDKKFITITNSRGNHINNYLIGNLTKAYITDINIQLEKKVFKIEDIGEDLLNLSIENKKRFDKKIIDLSENIFLNSRFFNDPNINKKVANGVYKNWVNNSFDKENKYFITYIDDYLKGFLIFSILEDSAVIELISVDSNFRKVGIGKKLIASLNNFLYRKDIKNILVGTQVENINAINFYKSCGCKIKDLKYIYHLWK